MPRISPRFLLCGLLPVAGCIDNAGQQVATSRMPLPTTVAFTVPEVDLLPENVAFDPVEGAFFLGSTRKGKIVRIRRDGAIDDFVGSRQDGLWMVIGMKVDAERRVLWVCSSGGGNLERDYDRSQPSPAGVFQFDLATGRLLARATLPGGPASHFFNDLVLAPNGDAYVTHMFDEPAIYRVRAGSDQLERWLELPPESYPNGVTFGPGGELLVAMSAGIAAIDTATRALRMLEAPAGISTRGIDGLYLSGDHLIGVRPDAGEVRSYLLGTGPLRILGTAVLESAHPAFSNPTTGVVVADTIFVVANSHFPLVADDGSLPDSPPLTPPVVLRVGIR